jgi:hypothetical protein
MDAAVKPIILMLACVAFLLAYTALVGQLRNIFDDEWPYINVFLETPGKAAATTCVAVGLILCMVRYKEFPTLYRRAGIGFVLLLLSGLLKSVYVAWAIDHRTELDDLIFKVPWRMFLWERYFFLGVPELVSAFGYGFIVWAIAFLAGRDLMP